MRALLLRNKRHPRPGARRVPDLSNAIAGNRRKHAEGDRARRVDGDPEWAREEDRASLVRRATSTPQEDVEGGAGGSGGHAHRMRDHSGGCGVRELRRLFKR